MEWTIAAPFVHYDNVAQSQWLELFMESDRHTLRHVPRRKPLEKWHDRKSKFTSLDEWLVYLDQAKRALQEGADGVITVFPQLASAVGIQQNLSRQHGKPVVAWLFNVGTCSDGLRKWMARASLRHIDRFVVHTRRERQIYSDWLNLPIERFEFVPYQSAPISVTYEEEMEHPFVASLGSAHRDFPTLFEAVKRLNIPTIVASGKSALAGLQIPANVQTPLGIARTECFRLAQQGRINVVPLQPKDGITAAGQVTIVEAMFMGRPLIATRCNGVEDYIIHGETGWLVEPNSTESMLEAIDTLWNDTALRQRLGQAAQRYAQEYFSDQAAGRHLTRILNEVADQWGF
ncbi:MULTISPECIES: glycosyltransferase [unclassified Leptolyngbya]|uniref:glycosyltransferase family 4 protein n=1 Tax=unclassified Leptolyngbya TaxID=2650499 RepID=UPI00168978E8|nr:MULTISPECIES: glycosyltransferase [unclassified Leptolyngbya]MBD1910298.1 glycosyltransferase [Leptolyngbya sp. FACHB-8]MBD2155790.1 glycosyltransferase [Leptolyngbya sp. FACHB-16]